MSKTLIVIIFLGIWVLPFLVLGFERMTRASKASRLIIDLETDGIMVDGRVTDFTIRPIKTSAICQVSYRYNVEGKTYEHSQEVGKEHILARGTSVKVLCLPRSPWIAMLTEEDRDDTLRTRLNRGELFAFALALFCAIAVPIISSISLSSR
jgi:hypothetical protein